MIGRDEEARAEAAEVLRINPKFSVDWFAKTTLLKDRSVVDKSSDALRKAGCRTSRRPALTILSFIFLWMAAIN